MARTRKYCTFITLCFICSLAQPTIADPQYRPTQWQRQHAIAAVESVDLDRAVYEIGNISSLADSKFTLSQLDKLETRRDWPMPAREAALYQFTRSLAELPRDAVGVEVIQHLQNYQALTLVPHEDHADAYVPLFNIRGAAMGVENGWQRAEFAIEAGLLLEDDPTTLVAAYVKSVNHMQRSAYLDILQSSTMANVISVQNVALGQLGQNPVLTPVVGVTTVITADIFAIQQLLSHGRGAGLSSTLVQLGTQLQQPEMASLLTYGVQQAPASNATLAIAAWWPRLRHDGATRDMMVTLLADPALGASAALALAQNPDILTIRVLQDTANGDSSAARRAQMALDFNRDGLTGGLQP